MIYFAVIVIMTFITAIVMKEREYHKTTYYKDTRNSLVFMNGGQLGEYGLFLRLEQMEQRGAKFLFNVYLPMGYDRTTEVDMIMISDKGIFVFESKNYSGWIFGSENQKKWTVVYKGGRKERLVNPVKQNDWHIQCLKKQIDIATPIYSVIAFSNSCTLKKVAVFSKNIIFGYVNDIVNVIYDIHKDTENRFLSENNINDIYNVLYPMTKVDKYVKKKHVNDIRNAHIPN
ncbi:MAG: NERD domain-containing protein [Acidaminococcaceae bacterium]|nr:NERD domain-containing protein [Acidaminococcaceae bacterium]